MSTKKSNNQIMNLLKCSFIILLFMVVLCLIFPKKTQAVAVDPHYNIRSVTTVCNGRFPRIDKIYWNPNDIYYNVRREGYVLKESNSSSLSAHWSEVYPYNEHYSSPEFGSANCVNYFSWPSTQVKYYAIFQQARYGGQLKSNIVASGKCSTNNNPTTDWPDKPSVSCSRIDNNFSNLSFFANHATYYKVRNYSNGMNVIVNSTGNPTTKDVPCTWDSGEYYFVQGCNHEFGCGPSNHVSCPCSAPEPRNAILYEHSNYRGSTYSIINTNANCTNLPWWFNDETSSVKIPSGWSLKLYEHGGCTGRSMTFTSNTPSLPLYFNDVASSYDNPMPTPSNFSFSVNSSCDPSDCHYQNNKISMYANNATYFKIKYWNNGWKHLATSYSSVYTDRQPAGTSRAYLVEAWNTAGYVNANPQYHWSQALNCPCVGLGLPCLTSCSRNCNDPVSNTLNWTYSGVTPDRFEVHRYDNESGRWKRTVYPVDHDKRMFTDTNVQKTAKYNYSVYVFKSGYNYRKSETCSLDPCQKDKSFSGVFIGKNVEFDSPDSEITIKQDSSIINNPPPGITDLLKPSWFKITP